jgi:polyisoprenoid-binding protein YceI
MNIKISLAFLMLIIFPLFSGFRSGPGTHPGIPGSMNTRLTIAGSLSGYSADTEGFEPLAGETEKYVIDKEKSIVTWKCSMVFADKGSHYGYVSLSKGELVIEKGELAGGIVEVDLNTISDELHNSNNNLIEHLQSPDFFDVKKFPSSAFVITKVVSAADGNINVTGNLTIKDITHEIIFPAKIEVKGKVVTANGKMTIDRTKWDIRYRSGKFFDDLADGAISDDIEFDLKIVAKK